MSQPCELTLSSITKSITTWQVQWAMKNAFYIAVRWQIDVPPQFLMHIICKYRMRNCSLIMDIYVNTSFITWNFERIIERYVCCFQNTDDRFCSNVAGLCVELHFSFAWNMRFFLTQCNSTKRRCWLPWKWGTFIITDNVPLHWCRPNEGEIIRAEMRYANIDF